MIVRCEVCGRRFAKTPYEYNRSKHHYCSKKCKGTTQRKLYTVYDNRTDFPVMIGGTVEECAEAMGIQARNFHATKHLSQKGRNKKWTIIEEKEEEDERCNDAP